MMYLISTGVNSSKDASKGKTEKGDQKKLQENQRTGKFFSPGNKLILCLLIEKVIH